MYTYKRQRQRVIECVWRSDGGESYKLYIFSRSAKDASTKLCNIIYNKHDNESPGANLEHSVIQVPNVRAIKPSKHQIENVWDA